MFPNSLLYKMAKTKLVLGYRVQMLMGAVGDAGMRITVV